MRYESAERPDRERAAVYVLFGSAGYEESDLNPHGEERILTVVRIRTQSALRTWCNQFPSRSRPRGRPRGRPYVCVCRDVSLRPINEA